MPQTTTDADPASLHFRLGSLAEAARQTNARIEQLHTDFAEFRLAMDKRFATKEEVGNLADRMSAVESKLWKIGLWIAAGAAGGATAVQNLFGG